MAKKRRISLIGRGFVGDALYRSFASRGVIVKSYDKYKNIGSLKSVLDSEILFLCLPTPFVKGSGFDKSALIQTCTNLYEQKYDGLVVVKSTVEPGTTKQIGVEFGLNIAHNPEFLTARTNYEDFDSQKHIVIGKTLDSEYFDKLVVLYSSLYPEAKVSICSSDESECMKIFLNAFYASKVQFFNELYLLSNKIDVSYDKVKGLMLLNDWINPAHTDVPGPDGQISYGGACFPKDTMALEEFMKKSKTLHGVLSAVIDERNSIRDD